MSICRRLDRARERPATTGHMGGVWAVVPEEWDCLPVGRIPTYLPTLSLTGVEAGASNLDECSQEFAPVFAIAVVIRGYGTAHRARRTSGRPLAPRSGACGLPSSSTSAARISYLAAERVERVLGDVEWIPTASTLLGGRIWAQSPAVRRGAERRAVRAPSAARVARRLPGVRAAPRCGPRRTPPRSDPERALPSPRAGSHSAAGLISSDPEILAEAAAAAGVPLEDCLAAAGDPQRDGTLHATARGLLARGCARAARRADRASLARWGAGAGRGGRAGPVGRRAAGSGRLTLNHRVRADRRGLGCEYRIGRLRSHDLLAAAPGTGHTLINVRSRRPGRAGGRAPQFVRARVGAVRHRTSGHAGRDGAAGALSGHVRRRFLAARGDLAGAGGDRQRDLDQADAADVAPGVGMGGGARATRPRPSPPGPHSRPCRSSTCGGCASTRSCSPTCHSWRSRPGSCT